MERDEVESTYTGCSDTIFYDPNESVTITIKSSYLQYRTYTDSLLSHFIIQGVYKLDDFLMLSRKP